MNISEKNNEISKIFYKRYFEQNAINKIANEMTKFLWFKEGHFINPLKKEEIAKKYAEEEIDNFYNKNILIMPQVEFCITTRCTLKCKDCCALIPQLDKEHRIEMSFDDFKLYLDKILNNVDGIRRFIILGGETLMNPELPKMIEYAAGKEKIFDIEIITNATILPNQKLIDCLKKYNKKVFVYNSNYKGAEELANIIKIDEFEKVLNKNNIKHLKFESWSWKEEFGFSSQADDDEKTKEKFFKCDRIKCTQVIDGFLYICSKASAGKFLNGIIADGIDILNSKDLRNEIIEFYKAPYTEACKYCILSEKLIQPALQA